MREKNKVKVALVKGKSRYKNLWKALHLLDIELPTKRIMIKPNFVSTSIELAATPIEAVKVVLDFFLELGVKKFLIAEGSAENTFDGFRNFGYFRLKDEYPVEFLDLNKDDTIKVKILDKNFQPLEVEVAKTPLKYYRVSVTRLKTHDSVIVTLSLKNMIVGCLPGENKGLIHQGYKAINLNLAILAKLLMPDLAVLDGFIGMEGNGPCFGTTIAPMVAIASKNAVACDSVAAKVMGFDPDEVGYLFYCRKLYLKKDIEIVGNKIEECILPFTPHYTYKQQLEWKVEGWERILSMFDC